MFGTRKKAVDGVEKLRGVSFFDGFTDDELQRVAELADDVEAETGASARSTRGGGAGVLRHPRRPGRRVRQRRAHRDGRPGFDGG